MNEDMKIWCKNLNFCETEWCDFSTISWEMVHVYMYINMSTWVHHLMHMYTSTQKSCVLIQISLCGLSSPDKLPLFSYYVHSYHYSSPGNHEEHVVWWTVVLCHALEYCWSLHRILLRCLCPVTHIHSIAIHLIASHNNSMKKICTTLILHTESIHYACLFLRSPF